MEKIELKAKVNIDAPEIDELFAKVEELKEALWALNGLLGESTDLKPIEFKLNIEV